MKVYINILLSVILCSCNTLNQTRINQSQLLADDINSSIDDFIAIYYRYPDNAEEFYKFTLSNYDLNNKNENKVVKYLKAQKDNIYIYSTNHFMFFCGKKDGIVIDRTLGLCDWLKIDNYKITTKINFSNFFGENGQIIRKGNDEFENGLKNISGKYKLMSFNIINGDSIVNRGVFQYDRKKGLVPLCELSNLSECDSFMIDLKYYLKKFTLKNNEIDKILFHTIIKKNNIPCSTSVVK